ncbi:MAG: CoA pyrophosphatase [Bacteroidales bacterium]|nr:CoA pyrophosphatase [Bacteroidales bacterium]MDY0314859.1 CoA pyrophosphatase [Bacteroidales bacterium]NLB86429.1 CoA pyrophosphatase [Bacteroidales bacterium]
MITTTENIEILKRLKLILAKSLPGVSAQKKMIPNFPTDAPEYFNYSQKLKDAAVLIVLFEENSSLKTFFIERTQDAGPHSGQIAFPGGRAENTDKDLIDTALREAYEETGVKVKPENVIGCLSPVQIPISGFSVLPVVAFCEELPKFIPCKKEVKSIFTVDLINLLENESIRNVYARNTKIQAPCFVNGDKIIWGATAMVLKEFKEIFNELKAGENGKD